MNKEEALNFIHNTERFGSVLGLESIKRLCAELDSPEEGQRFIHIAGTNGKGSVASALAAILTHAGYKTGLYTSPALVDFNERIKIDSEPIGDGALCRETKEVKAACERIVKKGFPHPTEFEIVTALGLLHFKKEKCGYVVLEVGLGGRLDATNVIKNPALCIITSLSLDHTDRLGDTIEAIAGEKCGIIKGNVPVLTTRAQEPGAMNVIKESTGNLKTVPVPEIKEETLDGIRFDFCGINDIFFPLTGEHQAQNASLAIYAAKELGISDDDIKEGIKNTYHPARMEKMSCDPLLILDGAHNPSAMSHLEKNIKALLPEGKRTLIIGMLKDKDFEASAKIIAPLFDEIITVDINSPRALPKEELASVMRKYCPSVTPMALSEAYKSIEKGRIYVVAGSLYMAGEFKKLNQKYHKVHL